VYPLDGRISYGGCVSTPNFFNGKFPSEQLYVDPAYEAYKPTFGNICTLPKPIFEIGNERHPIATVSYFDLGHGQFYFPAFCDINSELEARDAIAIIGRLPLQYFDIPAEPVVSDFRGSSLFGSHASPIWYVP
jgi:hypothetical protein